MGHSEIHAVEESESSMRPLMIAFSINTLFFLLELYGAYVTGSLTLFADAIHMVTDSGSLLLAIGAAYLATKAADAERTFGYERAEVIGGFLNGIILIATVVYIIFDAYTRLQNPQAIDGGLVLVIGIIGLGANLGAAYVLHSETHSLNAKGAYLHLLADAFGSIAVIASGLLILVTKLYVFDIVFAIIVAGIIAYSVFGLVKEATHILLQGTPDEFTVSEIESILYSIESVSDVHHIHIWSLSSSQIAVTAHIVIEDSERQTEVLEEALTSLEEYGIDHPTVQIELTTFDERDHSCYEIES